MFKAGFSKAGAIALAFLVSVPTSAAAWDCIGYVVSVGPVFEYNHAKGTGFLSVRSGPGGGQALVGELYQADQVAVLRHSGKWYEVQCEVGQCQDPFWGRPYPRGWVFGDYLSVGGECP